VNGIAAEAVLPVQAKLAATVVLVRDGAHGLEVLMIVRHHDIDVATGAAVFPGGKIAHADHDPRLDARSSGLAGHDSDRRAARVAAIRETYEECGVLLARPAGTTALLGRDRQDALRRCWQQRQTHTGSGFVDMVCDEALDLAVDCMLPFAHWVTPQASPKRFDTHFFIAQAPAEQVALHDGSEAVDAFWVRPADALEDSAQRRRTIMFPTLSNLALLAQSGTVAAALDAARSRPLLRIQPTLTQRADGKRVPTLPAGAGYPALSDELMDRVAR